MELFGSASPLQIVLSNEIDDLCTQFLKGQIETAFKTLTFPRPFWNSVVSQESFDVLATLLYQLSSLGRGSLGNEVSKILLVNSNDRLKRVSPKLKTYEILLNSVFQLIFLLAKKWGQKAYRRTNSVQSSHHDHPGNSPMKDVLVNKIYLFFKRWMPALSRIYSIIRLLFFINKHHCRTLSQLLLGLRYISIGTSERSFTNKKFFLLLFYNCIRLAISILKNTKRGKHLLVPETDNDSWSLESATLENSEAFSFIPAPSRKCALCMEWMHRPTVTECGHIYCWHCIYNWTKTKPECPLCRSFASTSKLILLR
ncbi:peroxisomal ubiquitin-protein ligase E3 involved in peroxisome organization and biogenesis [Schizosaccharomyces osmophilus]|uniref:RING-type E3 ubiquitin transferase n=1 Tax=Schizosaccharomyces osmophilus TaxID=2545709 RepID=A0AAF0AUL4_9SCHI|nr:peroxisomal ubiquitin-protein ligase E3 involved in peroxisome organization and biogenesis [Schizosaccharomyces osmophilus]WBW72616.1 peroxisomal ubiquitin-protein ligase E3 involved in peroxisome organization and biogenesis [Schizosaccharomyces osmophilus]